MKINKDQKVAAKNLQTVLLVVSGDRDEANECQNDVGNKKWMTSGVYEQETGIFYIRDGEHIPIQNHFKLLKYNRL